MALFNVIAFAGGIPPHSPPMNRLLFGDNLQWLRDAKLFPDASVDLVYLDPPFNSNADYNVLFREASGEASQAQFHAFTDTWNWADAAQTYAEFVDSCPNTAVVEMVEALHSVLKKSPMMPLVIERCLTYTGLTGRFSGAGMTRQRRGKRQNSTKQWHQ